MGLILRSSSLANTGNTVTVKNSPLEYNEGDGNFVYLLTNMSGSNIAITGQTGITGSATISGNLNVIGTTTTTILLAQTITSSVAYVTGSTRFGSSSLNTHQFTGSVSISSISSSLVKADSNGKLINAVAGIDFVTGSSNIYNSDGALTGNRIVNLTGSTLTFISGSITGSSDALINGTTAGAGAGAEWTVFGVQAASKASNSYGVAIGYKALSSSLSTGGVAVGRLAARDTTTGADNTAIGTNALLLNTTGQENTAIGGGAISDIVRGSFNTSVGKNNLRGISTGSYNTSVGCLFTTGILTGSYNTIIGASITGLSSTLNNNIILADGQGNIKYRWDTTQNNIYGNLAVTGSAIATNGFTGSLLGTATTGSTLQGIPASGFVTNINDNYTSTGRITDIITLTQAEFNTISASASTSSLYIII